MVTFFKRWVAAASFVAVGLFALTGVAHASHSASTTPDASISSVNVDSITSTALSAKAVTVKLTVVTKATIAKDDIIYIDARQADCNLTDYSTCTFNFADASATINGTAVVDSSYDSRMELTPAAAMSAGTYTIILSNVTNPASTTVHRLLLSLASSWSAVETGDVSIGTLSGPIVTGTPLVQGTITDAKGNPIMLYGNVRNEDWSMSGYFNSDQGGYYAAENPGFKSGETVTTVIYPDASSGLFTTEKTFTYSGSTQTLNITPDAATKTIKGTVTYADSGAAVTTAAVSTMGGSYASDNTDENGAYSLTLAGGEYEVCLSEQWKEDGARVEKDWYVADGGQNCQPVSFKKDDTTQEEIVNFSVKKADARIKGVFKNPDGSVPNGGWVNFSTMGLWFGGNVDSEDGSFSIAVVGGNTTSTTQSTTLRIRAVTSTVYDAQYSPGGKDEHTYWDSGKITVEANQTLDLGTITLKEKDVVFTATIVDTNGSPISGMRLDSWRDGGGWAGGEETDADGKITMYLYPGKWHIRPSTYDKTQYVYAGKEFEQDFKSGESASTSFTVTATTLTVTVNTRTKTGELAEVNGWANCWNNDQGYGFGGQVQYGTGTFGAVGGSYFCNIWSEDQTYQASGESEVKFVDGTDSTIEFTMLQRTASARIFVKDQDGALVKSSSARVFANSPGMGWNEERLENGEATIMLAPGSYSIGVWFEDGNSTEYISSWNAGVDMELKENDKKSDTITVYAVSATFTAHLEDNKGNLVPNGWVGCGNWAELEGQVAGDFEGGKVIDSGAQSGSDGTAVVGLVKGHVYECWVGVHSDFSNLIGPASQEIDMTNAKTAEGTFIFKEATGKIVGEVSMAADAGVTMDDVDFVWCNGWAEEGYNAWDDASENSYSLNVLEGTWYVWCGTEIRSKDGTREWYQSDDTTVIVSEEGKITQNFELSKSLFTVPETFSTTFSATEQTALNLPDGSSLTIPSGAIASSGQLTLTATPETNVIRGEFDSPFGFPYNFEVYDSEGTLIETFNDSVTLEMSYDESIVQALGLDETDLAPKYYDEDEGAWKNVDNVALDTDANVITFTLSHFTQVGLVYNNVLATVSSSPSNPPRGLKAKQVTKTSAVLTWKKPSSGSASTYTVQVRKFKQSDKDAWTKYTGVKGKKKKATGLSKGMRYQFRVAACNDSGCSKYTKWQKFKTRGKK